MLNSNAAGNGYLPVLKYTGVNGCQLSGVGCQVSGNSPY